MRLLCRLSFSIFNSRILERKISNKGCAVYHPKAKLGLRRLQRVIRMSNGRDCYEACNAESDSEVD